MILQCSELSAACPAPLLRQQARAQMLPMIAPYLTPDMRRAIERLTGDVVPEVSPPTSPRLGLLARQASPRAVSPRLSPRQSSPRGGWPSLDNDVDAPHLQSIIASVAHACGSPCMSSHCAWGVNVRMRVARVCGCETGQLRRSRGRHPRG